MFIWIIFYVDDFKILATDDALGEEFHTFLKTKYADMKEVLNGFFLGIHEQKFEEGSVFTKPEMLAEVFNAIIPDGPTITSKHFLEKPSPMTLEYVTNIEEPGEPADAVEYRSFLGKLQQQLPVRPDIAFALSKCGTRNSGTGPNVRDREALVQVANYLWQTQEKGLFLKRGDRQGREMMVRAIGFADAAGTTGSQSRSQICTGFAITLLPRGASDEEVAREIGTTGLVNVRSFRTSETPLSLTDAEIVGLVEETKDAIWVKSLMKDLHQEQVEATPIYNDNASGLHLVTKYDGKHKRVRYILDRVNFCLDKVKQGIVRYLYLKSEDLPVDAGTKPFVGGEHQRKALALLFFFFFLLIQH